MAKAKIGFDCMWGSQLVSYRAGEVIDNPALAAYLQETSPDVLDVEKAPEAGPKTKAKADK